MKILNDFTTTVKKALEEIDPNYMDYEGLVICGTHSPHDVEEMIEEIRKAREKKTPFLGICMGMEYMLIEFAQNVLEISDAMSEEININTKNPIFIKLPELRVGIKEVERRQESHWHNYYFNKAYAKLFSSNNWQFVFKDGIMEIARYVDHPFFEGVQFHPEYSSSKLSPHPLLKRFIKLCRKDFQIKQDYH